MGMTTEVSEWLNKKFLEWQNQTGKWQSWKSFANYIGVSYTTLSGWRNMGISPAGDNLRQVAKVLGLEIYEILGQPVPPDLAEDERLAQLPPDLRELYKRDLEAFTEEFLRRHGWRKRE